ncbi:Ig-like domain repeat protein [Steroidobacter sp.]|uniref:Ig-like domain repeat protein n=1 Tax=Steroidobacter sp. TaxID=1978227 RepID=UPI001A571BF5|nr:Ig-like domain repeat protein [Steroidobacter sp.]MBL8269846.1 Ig-like domain repeat protein [Steroidobacter sp.]
MSNSLLRAALISAGLVVTFSSAHAALTPSALHLDVAVSDIGTDNNIATSSTSRKLAVGADGTIYALFRSATNGIRVAKSIDRGQSFSASVQVSATDGEAEIGIANDGDLHVTWVSGSNAVHAISRDGGVTFSAPVTAGFATSAHMALDGDYVYIIPSSGQNVFHSDNDGASFSSTSTGSMYAFSDIFVDHLTHDVIAVVDDPSVYYFTSTDHGQTFSAAVTTGKMVMYSVGALSITDTGRYVFMAGLGGNLERFDIDNAVYTSLTVNATAGNTTRSLSADIFGNVVSGYLESGSNDLKFEHSNDLGTTFGPATTVATSATRANAAINNINGDILFLYEKANQVYLSTYERGLIEYDVNVSPSALNFGTVDVGDQASLTLTLSSVASVPVSIASIVPTTGYTTSDNCGGTLAVGASCTVTVTFSPSAIGAVSGSVTMNFGGASRPVSVNGSGVAARPATTTALTASATDLEPGDDVTLTAEVTGSSPTGTVNFTDGGAAVPGCTGVALSGTTATCALTGLTAGVKQYAAVYGGDSSNARSTSSAVTVNVRQRFTVTLNAGSNGSINPGTAQTVVSGQTAAFNIVPNSGYRISSVTGCGGSLSGSTYTTGAISGNCAITASFELANENVNVTAKSKGGGGAMAWPMLLIGALGVFARRVFPLFAAGLLLGQSANAEAPQGYVGASFGQAKGEQNRGDVAADLQARGFTGSDIRLGDSKRDAYRLFAGFRLTQNWGVEVGYTDLGEVSSSASASVPAGQAAAYANALVAALPVAPSGYEATVSYRYPFTPALALSARAGVWKWESEQRAVFGNQRVTIKPDGTDVVFGIGGDWSFATRWSVGLEISRYQTSEEDVDLLGANVKFAW